MGVRNISGFNQQRSLPLLVLALAAISSTAWSKFDPETLSPADAKALHAAERALFEMVRPGTTELLRPPETDAERYVIKRHKRWVERLTRAPVAREFADGTVVIDYPDGAGSAIGLTLDDAGQPTLQCASPLAMIGLSPHDFHAPHRKPVPAAAQMPAASLSTMALSSSAPATSQRPILEAVYTDPPGYGFNDERPVSPARGNPHTTLGAQRRAVLEAGLNIWSTFLDSKTTIRVNAFFEDLGCDGPLGTGGASAAFNFPNAPEPDVQFPVSLASALSGQQLGTTAEMRIRFNSRRDGTQCSHHASRWLKFRYDLGNLSRGAGSGYPFLPLVLHEIGHGLGIQLYASRETGEFWGTPPRPDGASRFIYNTTLEKSWREMDNAERVSSAQPGSSVVWSGPRASRSAAEFLRPSGRLLLDEGDQELARFPAHLQGYAPFLPDSRLHAPARVLDQACEPFSEDDDVEGTILIVHPGACPLSWQWRHAQEAGAAALVFTDDAIAVPLVLPVSSVLPTPIWSIRTAVRNRIEAALPTDVVLTFRDAPPLGIHQGMPRLHPTLSHFSNGMVPQSVMSPSAGGGNAFGLLDLAPGVLYDLGWPDANAKQAQFSGSWFNPDQDGTGCQLTLEGDDATWILTCYLYDQGEQMWLIGTGKRDGALLDIDDVHITSGADYGDDFDTNQVEVSPWGRIKVHFIDCNNALFDFQPEPGTYRRFKSQMERIVPADCRLRAVDQPDRAFSGNYYDPERSGEGIQVTREADGETAVVTWYSYVDGRQLWAVGSGLWTDAGVVVDELITTSGGLYGDAFRPEQVDRLQFGRLTLEPIDCNNVRLIIQADIEGLDDTDRVLNRIVPAEDC